MNYDNCLAILGIKKIETDAFETGLNNGLQNLTPFG